MISHAGRIKFANPSDSAAGDPPEAGAFIEKLSNRCNIYGVWAWYSNRRWNAFILAGVGVGYCNFTDQWV